MRVELYGHQKGMLIKAVSFNLQIKKNVKLFLLSQDILKRNQNKTELKTKQKRNNIPKKNKL